MARELTGRVDEKGIMLRPSMKDEYVRRRAAELMLPHVKRWCVGSTDEEILSDLEVVVGGSGYDMARDLETKFYWAVDDSLVSHLMEHADVDREAVEEMTKKWVRCLGVKLDLSVGDHVTSKNVGRHNGEVGVITDLVPELAMYKIRYPDMEETSCYVVHKEDCTHYVRVIEAANA